MAQLSSLFPYYSGTNAEEQLLIPRWLKVWYVKVFHTQRLTLSVFFRIDASESSFEIGKRESTLGSVLLIGQYAPSSPPSSRATYPLGPQARHTGWSVSLYSSISQMLSPALRPQSSSKGSLIPHGNRTSSVLSRPASSLQMPEWSPDDALCQGNTSGTVMPELRYVDGSWSAAHAQNLQGCIVSKEDETDGGVPVAGVCTPSDAYLSSKGRDISTRPPPYTKVP